MDKKTARIRRARRARSKIRELAVPRLTVHRTPRHIYAQVIAPNGSEVVAYASTLQADVKSNIKRLIAHVLNIMAASRRWQTLRVKPDCNSKG
jgi:ribosomal protein L18